MATSGDNTEPGLPDAPGFVAAGDSPSSSESGTESGDANWDQQLTPSRDIATIHTKVIQPGMTAPQLGIGDKILLGMASATSAKAAVGWVAASVYEQTFDTGPNYGQTAKGFAQRLGASVARDTSETIFSDSVMAPILHEDPRYYRIGPGHNFFTRFFYAGTRTLVTRTDAGTATPNFALIGGNLAGAALTQAYYPAINTGFGPTMKTFAGSLGGSSVGFIVDEFLRDALALAHHDRTE